MSANQGRCVSLRCKLLFVTGSVIAVTCLVFTAVSYLGQRREMLRAVDALLLVAARLEATVVPSSYYDRISDADSVAREEYDRIVAVNNRLCLDLGLQYLWSVMVIDGRVVFTTATSPSKHVANGDHAGFFSDHGDPGSFDAVFGSMTVSYNSFHNEWGHGRMVLVPARDANGRPYCFGASMGLDALHASLRKTLRTSVAAGVCVLLFGLLLNAVVSRTLSRPIVTLTEVADGIAHGEMDLPVPESGSEEMRSLSRSVVAMRTSIRTTISELRVEVDRRRSAQEELARHRDHLEQLVNERTSALQQSNEDLEQFAYVASHDLQEPLRTVRSYTELMVERYRGKLDEEADEFIHFIVDGVSRMQDLIWGLLEYSRVTTHGQVFARLDLQVALDGALANLAAVMKETGAEVTHDPLPSVMGDETQLTQLLQNLLANSIKFRGEAPPRIHVTAEKRTGEWVFGVRDNGIGFDLQYKDRIFEIFERLYSRSQYAGTGIGLAFCRRIVQRHGGRIWADSQLGQGSTFYFAIPEVEEREA